MQANRTTENTLTYKLEGRLCPVIFRDFTGTQKGYNLCLSYSGSLRTLGTYIPKVILVAEREVKPDLVSLITSTMYYVCMYVCIT